MFKNYFKAAVRVLWKDRLYSFINVLGLAVGLAGFMLIMIYVTGELSYDRHHADADRTYRVAMDLEMSGNITRAAVSGGIFGKLMHEEIKEVESYTRMVHYPREVLLSLDEQKIYFDDMLFADSSFFSFFDYEVLQGDPANALREPYSLVLPRSSAELIFGTEDPIGKALKWDGSDTYIVRAVVEDPVKASHIHFDALVSFSTLENIPPYNRYINTLYAFVTFNYIKLYPGFEPIDIESSIDSLVQKHMGEGMRESGAGFHFYLQPIKDIYLHSDLRHEMKTGGNVNNLYIFTAVALFILLIAGINFITLSTARSIRRNLEVGVRKVFGASRSSLISQFLFESVVMSLLGMMLAILMLEIMIPRIEHLSGTAIPILMGDVLYYLPALAGLTILVGILSGIYPAIVISSYNPLGIIQKRITKGKRVSWFRNSMVVLQFLITIFMICGTIIITLQLNYMKNTDTGISLDNRIIIPLRGAAMIGKYDELKTSVLGLNGVEAVTASSTYPGNFRQRAAYYPEGSSRNDMWMLQNVQVAPDYFDVMDIKLINGRGFSQNPAVDSLNVIVNEALVEEAGWKDPLGKFVGIPMGEESKDIKMKVIGVVADFNYASLHESIKPLLIMHDPNRFASVCVKIEETALQSSLMQIEEVWAEYFPERPFNYFLLKEEFEKLYLADLKLSEVFIWFTMLAIFIACMGLFGLSSFMVAQRTREIGIRKVLGAETLQVVYMFVKGFGILVLIAAVLAIPLSWYSMSIWLQNFAHQTPVYWWLFPMAVIIALIVATLTVVFQSLKAANRDPVDSIRWE